MRTCLARFRLLGSRRPFRLVGSRRPFRLGRSCLGRSRWDPQRLCLPDLSHPAPPKSSLPLPKRPLRRRVRFRLLRRCRQVPLRCLVLPRFRPVCRCRLVRLCLCRRVLLWCLVRVRFRP
ncbi:MAG: hypothetical protein FWF02_12500, partial [Micrococcales bacterium]|nr:hypothetical protein [Micrococcales bacterium]